MKPTASGGNKACVTRRVGGDQKGSESFKACRRTRKKEPVNAIAATPAQYRINQRGRSISKSRPAAAEKRPSTPLKVMMGPSARRYRAERSIKVRMTCKFSAA